MCILYIAMKKAPHEQAGGSAFIKLYGAVNGRTIGASHHDCVATVDE